MVVRLVTRTLPLESWARKQRLPRPPGGQPRAPTTAEASPDAGQTPTAPLPERNFLVPSVLHFFRQKAHFPQIPLFFPT